MDTTNWLAEWNRLSYLTGEAVCIAIDDVKIRLLGMTADRIEREGREAKRGDPESAFIAIEYEAYLELADNLRSLAKGIGEHKLQLIGQYDSAARPGAVVPDPKITDQGKVSHARPAGSAIDG